MNININISQAVLDIILGIIVIIQPKFIAWIIGIWLILTGLISLGIIKF